MASVDKPVTFMVKCTMGPRWVPQFLGMLRRMQYLGAIGSSREVTLYSDGDGDYRPKFEWIVDSEPAEGLGPEKRYFDAG